MAGGTINAVSYYEIVTTGTEDWIINPFDLNGNPVSQMTIKIDQTIGQCNLFLPNIAPFNNIWDIKITVIANNGGGIFAPPEVWAFADPLATPPIQNFIGSSINQQLIGGNSITQLTIADSNSWYGVVLN